MGMKIFVLVGAFVAGGLAVPEAKADAEADPWGVYGGYGGYYGGYRGYGYSGYYRPYGGYGLYGYGKRDAEPTAEPTADADLMPMLGTDTTDMDMVLAMLAIMPILDI